MAALLLLLATILSTNPPTFDVQEFPVESRRAVYKHAKLLRKHGLARVAFAYLNASDEFREAIPAAMASVDPEGLHPEWGHELWRICKRESWCGKFGRTGVHEIDGWVGPNAYLWAVERGQLDPHKCTEHRLHDYTPVLKALSKWERKTDRKKPELRARIEGLPTGEFSAKDFATRGGFGQNAARNLRVLGECVAPTTLDDPLHAAMLAAKTFDECKVWAPDPDRPGRKRQRHCTCEEHVRVWVGVGRWDDRPLVTPFSRAKSRYGSVRMQCGEEAAGAYLFSEIAEPTLFVLSLFGAGDTAA